ncbi:PecA family PE domain-processing aspartic protease [Mycobacterium sp.]|uniref:PecA family PE domain-processing aspartic protease n=1 Tax=Mycobacterium sp. TaxID=1785 RepID=UPI002CE7FC25|nr:PecA family PE domain-processing aspartic protease [Mycobacterium sp.]HTY32421.1 PecA family PE domain-processing aspartic protease [Mycobacterium sp.]
MSFLTSPPEVISAMLHAGAGPAPMLAASAAWDGLATELGSAAQSFSSITSGLAGDAWQGAASTAMLSTAAQYTGVLSQAATQAQTAAAQAQAVAGEFESALAATVHPVLVSANRSQLIQLVFSNLFGQNAPAIAATEAEYEQMWAQDVSAMVGYHGGVSAAAAQLSSWASALQGLPAQASAAVAGSPAASALSPVSSAAANPVVGLLGGVEQNVTGVVGQFEHYAINVINAPTDLLFGRQLIPSGPQSTGGVATINGNTATAPLTIIGGTEPIVNASVGPGSAIPLLVDTGSTGLVVPFTRAGGLLGMLEMGIPRGAGIGGYSGGLDYLYLTYNAPVNFGGGLVTGLTPVNVELFAWPVSIQSAMTNGITFQSFFASDGASGVLGVGPNAGGPGPSIPLQALPGSFGQGLLINQTAANAYLQFGAAPTNLGSAITTLNGSPITDLRVQVGTGSIQSVPSIVDSGGVDGTLLTSLNAQPGQQIFVSAPDGTPLYNFTYNGDYFPTPISSGLMNTGNLIFQDHPIYIDYTTGNSNIYQ